MAEQKVQEGEAIRRKLHNTIQVGHQMTANTLSPACQPAQSGGAWPECAVMAKQPCVLLQLCYTWFNACLALRLQELKGNIRVFCRVRPPSGAESVEALPGQPVISYATTGECCSRAPQEHGREQERRCSTGAGAALQAVQSSCGGTCLTRCQ